MKPEFSKDDFAREKFVRALTTHERLCLERLEAEAGPLRFAAVAQLSENRMVSLHNFRDGYRLHFQSADGNHSLDVSREAITAVLYLYGVIGDLADDRAAYQAATEGL